MNKNEFVIGKKVSITKSFDIEEVVNFSKLSKDDNPIHINEEYARQTTFGRPIVQGMLVSSLFGGIFGSIFPGNGSIYLGQEVKFIKPNFVNDSITASVELVDIRDDKPIYTFSTKCFNSDNKITIDGEAVIIYNKLNIK